MVIPSSFKPYELLGVASDVSERGLKAAFKSKIPTPSRQTRAMVSVSYHAIRARRAPHRNPTNTYKWSSSGETVELLTPDLHVFTAIGHKDAVLDALLEPTLESKASEDVEAYRKGSDVLYLAARSGFYDVVKALLNHPLGPDVNDMSVHGSSCLHAASYYNHRLIVGLLLEHGAGKQQNRFGNTPQEEAATTSITRLLNTHREDVMGKFIAQTLKDGVCTRVENVTWKGELVARLAHRSCHSLDTGTRTSIDSIKASWELAYHGTRMKYLASIAKNGLYPSGTTTKDGVTIQPPPGHIQLSTTYSGIANWAKAIFVSPSLPYAADLAYADRVTGAATPGGRTERWCCLVLVRVKPGSFTSHESTTGYSPRNDEPAQSEYRVPTDRALAGGNRVISRVERRSSTVVTAIAFVRLRVLEDHTIISFRDLVSLFAEK